MSSSPSRASLAKIMLGVAEEAGALVMRGHRSRPHADEKGRADLVTSFDRASETLITSRLSGLAAGIPIVGEEASGDVTGPRSGRVLYVDPIDGTTNFVHGHPFWCVSIGLAEDDEPVAGAVVAPALGLSWVGWVASEGEGSSSSRSGAACSVSRTARLGDAMIATGFPTDRESAPANNFDSFIAVKKRARAVRRCGSAAIDLCFVADGTYDGFWERRLHVWDVMAGCALILAAGGRLTALSGGRPSYHEGNFVASNGLVHDELRETARLGA